LSVLTCWFLRVEKRICIVSICLWVPSLMGLSLCEEIWISLLRLRRIFLISIQFGCLMGCVSVFTSCLRWPCYLIAPCHVPQYQQMCKYVYISRFLQFLSWNRGTFMWFLIIIDSFYTFFFLHLICHNVLYNSGFVCFYLTSQKFGSSGHCGAEPILLDALVLF